MMNETMIDNTNFPGLTYVNVYLHTVKNEIDANDVLFG